MRKLIIVVMLFSMNALGMAPRMPDFSPEPTPPGEKESPPTEGVESFRPEDFLSHLKQLVDWYGARSSGNNVIFSFRSFWGSTVGVCYYSSSGPAKISLSKSDWNNQSNTFREMLAFHELGHCLLGRGHKNSNQSNRPESLMNSFLFNERIYQEHRDEYWKELFSSSGGTRGVSRSLGSDDPGGCQFGH